MVIKGNIVISDATYVSKHVFSTVTGPCSEPQISFICVETLKVGTQYFTYLTVWSREFPI